MLSCKKHGGTYPAYIDHTKGSHQMYTLSSRSFKVIEPKIDKEAFVAPNTFLAGDVRIAKYASIWPGAVARGDVNYISVGECSNVQDLACLHVADENPCIIGKYVTIGHGAVVHGCEIADHVLVGMNATVLTLVVGVPGKVIKTIDRMDSIHAQAIKYKCEWAIGYGVCPEIGGETYHGEKII